MVRLRRTPHLPPEMIELILLKSPAKSVLRLKSVSKSWNSIISHPLFIRNHRHHSKSRNVFLRTMRSVTPGLSLVKLEDGKLQTIKQLKSPLAVPRFDDHVCFCEYGVLLLTNDWNIDRCLLWNPSTQKTTRLLLRYGLYTTCSGICYDPASDDLQVVVVYHDSYAVYSCKNGSWSNKKQHPHGIAFFQPPDSSSGVSIGGAIYWLLRSDKYNCAKMIYYDPRDDRLKNLQKPKGVQGGLLRSQMLYLGGHLCLYRSYGNVIRIWRKEKGVDKNSWKELTIIRNVDKSIWLLEPVCFVGNKIVFQPDGGGDDKLWVYGPLDEIF